MLVMVMMMYQTPRLFLGKYSKLLLFIFENMLSVNPYAINLALKPKSLSRISIRRVSARNEYLMKSLLPI